MIILLLHSMYDVYGGFFFFFINIINNSLIQEWAVKYFSDSLYNSC